MFGKLRPHANKDLHIACTHHKTGTSLLAQITKILAEHYGWKYWMGSSERRPVSATMWMQPHSQIGKLPKGRTVRGVHIIRHPYEIICSGYLYHKACNESWCVDVKQRTEAQHKKYNFGGLSYQQILNSLDQSCGISIEILGRSYDAIMDMYNWDYSDERFLNIKFEDFSADFEGTIINLCTQFNIVDDLPNSSLLNKLKRCNVDGWSKAERRRNMHITNISGGERWPTMLGDHHFKIIQEKYPPDLLQKIGYD